MMRQVSRPVRRGAGRKGRKDLARSLPSQVTMARRSNAKGTWWSHWLADEERWCRGK